MSTENLPPRNKSQRLIEKKHKEEKNAKNLEKFKSINNIEDPKALDVLPGLNELTDSFNAFPSDVIGYFTLLKEIDAKCVFTVPYLKAYIERFLIMKKSHPKRNLLLLKIRNCIKELMPCLEEKMHVATIASDTVNKHISRIDQFYDIVIEKEIPEIIRIGPMWDPCMKVTEPKTAQQQRSESRREALAAKKANKGSEIDDDINNNTDDNNNSFYDDNIQIQSKKSNKNLKKETNPFQTQNHNHNETFNHNINHSSNNYSHSHSHSNSNSNSSLTKKRKIEGPNDIVKSTSSNIKKVKSGKPKKENKKEITNSDVLNSNHAIKSHLIQSTNSRKGHNGISNNNNNINNYNDNFSDNLSNNVSNFNNSKNKKGEVPTSPINYDGEPVYCYCQQVSYGEMVGCDGANCEKEWFHLPCTGLKELPKGEWYCDECKAKM